MPSTFVSDTQREEFRIDEMHPPISHYTDAVRWGDLLFVSGTSPLNPDMSVVSDDVAVQARKVFENMQLVFDAAGARFSDVLKVTVFLLDVDDRVRINPVRKEFFGDAKPASTLIGVKSFTIPGMKIEVEAVVGLRNR